MAAERLGESVRPPRLRPWADEIRKLHAAGRGPSWEVIEAGIRWLYSEANEGEYRIEVQSGRALREKWAKLVAAQKRAKRTTAQRAQARPEYQEDTASRLRRERAEQIQEAYERGEIPSPTETAMRDAVKRATREWSAERKAAAGGAS